MAADNGAIVVRDGSVKVIDGGAIEMAGDVSERAIDLAGDISFEAFDMTQDALAQGANLATESLRSSNDALAQIIERDQSEETQLATQIVRLGIPAVALVAAVYFWGNK